MPNEIEFRKILMSLIQNHGPEAVLIAAKKAAQKEPSLIKATCDYSLPLQDHWFAWRTGCCKLTIFPCYDWTDLCG